MEIDIADGSGTSKRSDHPSIYGVVNQTHALLIGLIFTAKVMLKLTLTESIPLFFRKGTFSKVSGPSFPALNVADGRTDQSEVHGRFGKDADINVPIRGDDELRYGGL